MKTPPTRKWTHINELRALLDRAAAEPGSKMVAVAMGPHGLEQTLERWAVTTQSEAHTWASGHLKAQARAPTPAVRYRWVRPGGKRAGSIVCRLVDRSVVSKEASALRGPAESRGGAAELAERARLVATQADLKKALADCGRLAQERDALREQLAAAQAANARKEELLHDARVLAAMVNAR